MTIAKLDRIRSKMPPLIVSVPYLWLLVFFAIPFLIILKISFAQSMVAQPPYGPLLRYVENAFTVQLNLNNYIRLFTDSKYVIAYLSSIKIAAISTMICLAIGYPMAYAISRLKPAFRTIALIGVLLPSWTSYLIRIYAWKGILANEGVLDTLLMKLGVIEKSLQLIDTPIAAYIGIIYCYLPYMILPLYASLTKLDQRMLEAAYDLGARPWKAFFTITLPLSRPGILAGCTLVMIPAIGEYAIPEMLGGSSTLMIGRVLWDEYFSARNWPVAAALAATMILLLAIPILLFNRYQQQQLQGTAT